MNNKRGIGDTKRLVVSAMFCSLAYIAVFVLRFHAQFLTFDFKDVFISMVSLLYGPIYGVISAAVVALLEFVTVSETGHYGLIMNFLSSGTLAFVIGIVYKYRRTFFGAIIAVITGVFSMVAVMMVANLVITPFYMEPRAAVVALLPYLLAFNLCKGAMNGSFMLLLYKPLVSVLRQSGLVKLGEKEYRFDRKTAILTCVCVAVIVASLVILFFALGGSLDFFLREK